MTSSTHLTSPATKKGINLFYKNIIKVDNELLISSPSYDEIMPYYIKLTNISFGKNVNNHSKTQIIAKIDNHNNNISDNHNINNDIIIGTLQQNINESEQINLLITC